MNIPFIIKQKWKAEVWSLFIMFAWRFRDVLIFLNRIALANTILWRRCYGWWRWHQERECCRDREDDEIIRRSIQCYAKQRVLLTKKSSSRQLLPETFDKLFELALTWIRNLFLKFQPSYQPPINILSLSENFIDWKAFSYCGYQTFRHSWNTYKHFLMSRRCYTDSFLIHEENGMASFLIHKLKFTEMV